VRTVNGDQPFRLITITDSGDPGHGIHHARGAYGEPHGGASSPTSRMNMRGEIAATIPGVTPEDPG